MDEITLRLAAPEEDDALPLEDFLKQLDAIRHALNETQRVVTKSRKPSLRFKVVGLRRSSPTEVTLRAEPITRGVDDSARVVDAFLNATEHIQRRRSPPTGFDGPALRAFQAMAQMVDKKVTPVEIVRDGRTVHLSRELANNVDSILGPKQYARGSVTGKLEKINLHRQQNVFIVYPIVGPEHGIACEFPARLTEQAVLAVNKYVDVTGRLTYNAVDSYPEKVRATGIEIYRDRAPFTLAELHGIAPNATGDKSSEDFIGRLRNEAY